MISILIATKNRPTEITSCVQSIIRSIYTNFEVIIIDQSNDHTTQQMVLNIPDRRVRYFHTKHGGKSNALNIGIHFAKGSICAFTDDDCIVSDRWLANIVNIFTHHPHIKAVFGQTKPFQPKQHIGYQSPSTFPATRQKIVDKPCYHATHVGFGNNMAIRKTALEKIGGFKSWLGPGSIGSAAEDAELMLRLLSNGYKILTSPKPIVYHNKWLTHKKLLSLNLSYSIGEVTCYSYFWLQGYKFSHTVVINTFYEATRSILNNRSITYAAAMSIALVRGILVAIWFSIIDPIPITKRR